MLLPFKDFHIHSKTYMKPSEWVSKEGDFEGKNGHLQVKGLVVTYDNTGPICYPYG
jgi:hypothetical protein